MHGVGPGSSLGGRYVLERRVQGHRRYERWLGHDQTLRRDVVLLCFPASSPTGAAALDAARRAAGVDDSRLVRVLDVGRDDETAFVVEEPLPEGHDLAELLDGGPLPAQEVRRLVGEAATALERARVRGLHHGVMGPRSLVRLGDGAVKVRGLAVEGALLGLDDVDGAQASRDDTVALVALAYAGLTGYWPLDGPVGLRDGLPPAPTVVGGIAAPSEITAGVPADLDTIARLTLVGADFSPGTRARGPLTPGDLAGQIAPWSSALDPQYVVPPAPVRRVIAPVDEELDGASSSDPGDDGRPGPWLAAARSPRSRTVLGMPVGATEPGAEVATGVGAGAPDEGGRLSTDTDSLDLRALRGLEVPGSDREQPEQLEQHEPERDVRGHRDGRAADVGRWSGGPLRMTAQVRLSDTLEETEDDLDPPLPLVGRRTLSGPPADHAGTALAAVAALVVVLAALGIVGVSRIGRSASTPVAATTTSAPATTTAKPTAKPSPTTTARPSAALVPVGVVQAQAWDPEGDNQEGNASAPRALDGDPATMWRSQSYRSAAFGGFGKTGIGLILDLGQQATVRQVQVELRGGADFTAYVASRQSLDGATSIGTSTGTDGTVTITAPGAGAKGQLVILWFTALAPDGVGGFRAQVAEARVSG